MIRSIPYLTMALGVLVLIVVGISPSVPPGITAVSLNAFTAVFPAMPGHRWWMQVVVSLVVLVAALYVLVFRKDDSKWAAGALGTILGYWLPS